MNANEFGELTQNNSYNILENTQPVEPDMSNWIKPTDWPGLDEKRFPSWVNETFEKYKLDKKNANTKNKNKNNKSFKPFAYQKFARDFMQNASPYRGILLYHGLGTGKTCTAITIAEALKPYKQQIIVLLPASLEPNFVEEGLNFCGSANKNHSKYTFVSYNATNTLKQLEKLGDLNNKVIIIEEVHNLISMITNLDSKKGQELYNLLLNAENSKIIALSGTPIVNEPFEIAVLLNILRGTIEVTQFGISGIKKIDKKQWDYKELEKMILDTTIQGNPLPVCDFVATNLKNKTIEAHIRYRSFDETQYKQAVDAIVKSAAKYNTEIYKTRIDKYTLFPDKLEDFNKIFIDSTDKQSDRLKNVEILRRRMAGLISYYIPTLADYPETIINEPERVPMSQYQFSIYKNIAKAERLSAMGRKYRIFTRQISNFVFPPDVPRPGFDEIVAKALKPNNKNAEKTEKKKLKKVGAPNGDLLIENGESNGELSREYKEKIEKTVEILKNNGKTYFSKENLAKYSPKMLLILNRVEKCPGLVFIYSDFRTLEGVGIFSLILEAHGYVPFDPANPVKRKTFALYSGDEDKKSRKATIKMFRDPKNAHGEYIKVILATKAGAEGLDLKRVRQIHIMEPYWNEVRADQVIGRGSRRKSHIDLPKNEQRVDVYRYLLVFTPEQEQDFRIYTKLKGVIETTDEQIYRLALRKKHVTDEILQTMKESAVDCILNLAQNPSGIRCHTYGDDVKGMAYMPKLEYDLAQPHKNITTVVKKNLVLITLDNTTGKAYRIDNKRKQLFELKDKAHKTPVEIAIKNMKGKYWYDDDTGKVYEYSYAKVDQPPIGKINAAKGVFVQEIL